MAGIAGIILKEGKIGAAQYKSAISSMLDSLSYTSTQLRNSYADDKCIFGNVVPSSFKSNSHFIFAESIQVYCIVEGLVFLEKEVKEKLLKKTGLEKTCSDYELIPYLFNSSQSNFTTYLTGTYNVFIYNRRNNEATLYNDRFGSLPLYYFESDSVFIFASKIESIISAGVLSSLEFDKTTILEHLYFNYTLSDHTYIKHIHTLPNATQIDFKQKKVKRSVYWNMNELFDIKQANNIDHIPLINEGIKKSLEKILSRYNQINVSLTGGWDSRVILSYLLPDYRDSVQLYSFGATKSDDIIIPSYIAEKEQLNYSPYILDQKYLDKEFPSLAQDTIRLSGGTRNYKRTHYLYAIQKIASFSGILISGIFWR